MQQRSRRGIWGTLAALFWAGTALAAAAVIIGGYVVPTWAAGLRARGIAELPEYLQVMVDLNSLARNLGVVLLPPLLVMACIATALYVRAGAEAVDGPASRADRG